MPPAPSASASAARSPRETVEEMLRTTVEGDREQRVDLYAPDTVVESPFAPPGIDRETRGRETLRARIKAFDGVWSFDSVDEVTVHETTDPQVVIAEFRVSGHINATSAPFTLGFVNVVRVVDGLIVHSRDYGNPLEVSALLAALPQG